MLNPIRRKRLSPGGIHFWGYQNSVADAKGKPWGYTPQGIDHRDP